jgi:hypothetical protein
MRLLGENDLYDSELYEMAIQYERDTKQKGRQNGVLGSTGVRVFAALLLKADTTGLCAGPLTSVASDAGLSQSATTDAMQRLVKSDLITVEGAGKKKVCRINLSWRPPAL